MFMFLIIDLPFGQNKPEVKQHELYEGTKVKSDTQLSANYLILLVVFFSHIKNP